MSVCSCSVMGFILTSLLTVFSLTARAADPVPVPVPLLTPGPVPGGDQERLEAPYLHLPVFLHFRKPRVDKQQFSPVHVKSRESLPERVRQVLVPAPRRRLKTRVGPNGPVRVTCNAGEMRVRVHSAILGAGGEHVHVRLGTCDVSRRTEQSVLFVYELHECGTQRQIVNKSVVYSNVLHFTPDASVSGSEPFSVPVQCHFNRFHYSYKIGFVPSVERLKFFKPMKTKGSITLTACDAQWNRLSLAEGFVIGQPMYFEAETLHVSDDERLFVHFCHVTTNSSRLSTPRVNIIDNYGCLINSKSNSQSRFINSSRRNMVRFTLDAFALQGKLQKYLFIHCEMSVQSFIPTETSKSCSYNHLERRWEELYGADSVCSCCDSSCVPKMPTLMRPLTSELGALIEQHQEGKSRKSPAETTEGIFTPEPEHTMLMTESQPKTISPERELASEHKHGPVTLGRTPTPWSKHGTLTPESEHEKNTLESTSTPRSDHGTLTPENYHGTMVPKSMSMPEVDNGTLMPEVDNGTLMPEVDNGTLMPEVDNGTLMPEVDNGTVLQNIDHGAVLQNMDHGTRTPEMDHGTRTPEMDHGTRTPEMDHGAVLQNIDHGAVLQNMDHGTRTPEMDHGTWTPEMDHGTRTPEMDHGAVLQNIDHGAVLQNIDHGAVLQNIDHGTRTPEMDHGTRTPEMDHGTRTPEMDHGTRTPEMDHGARTPEMDHGTMLQNIDNGTLTPEMDHGTLTPEMDHGTLTPEMDHGTMLQNIDNGTLTPEMDQGTLTPEMDQGTLTPEMAHGTLTPEMAHGTPETDHGTPAPESKHEKVRAETRPTLEGEYGSPTPDGEHETQRPATDQMITSNPHEGVGPGTDTTSVEQNTVTPVYKHIRLREPYRVFEEVFGLS